MFKLLSIYLFYSFVYSFNKNILLTSHRIKFISLEKFKNMLYFIKNTILEDICFNFKEIVSPKTTKLEVSIPYKACFFTVNLIKENSTEYITTLKFENICIEEDEVFNFSKVENTTIVIETDENNYSVYFPKKALEVCSKEILQNYQNLLELNEEMFTDISKHNNIINEDTLTFFKSYILE